MKKENINMVINHNNNGGANYINLLDKLKVYQEILHNTILSSQKYKNMDILSSGDVNACTFEISNMCKDIRSIITKIEEDELDDIVDITNKIQHIVNDLSRIFKSYGTLHFKDLITICFGTQFLHSLEKEKGNKMNIMLKYMHPTSYKSIPINKDEIKKKKIISKNKIVEDHIIVDSAETLDCFDLSRSAKSFQSRVYGVKVAIRNENANKVLIVNGVVDDIYINCLDHEYVNIYLSDLFSNLPEAVNKDRFKTYTECLNLKEILVYSKEDIYDRFRNHVNFSLSQKEVPINKLVNDFVNGDLYDQRKIIIAYLIESTPDMQYISYLLYSLLSNDTNLGSIDTNEQILLYDSLPWVIKRKFKDAMNTTNKYTTELLNVENKNIPIEQQICLLKADDYVKEKAMNKLRESQMKSEDSGGGKARQYLDGLMKIPFGIFKKEPILNIVEEIKHKNNELRKCVNVTKLPYEFTENNTTLEIFKNMYGIESLIHDLRASYKQHLIEEVKTEKRKTLYNNGVAINEYLKMHMPQIKRLQISNKKQEQIIDEYIDFIATNDFDILKQFSWNTKMHENIEQIIVIYNELLEKKETLNHFLTTIRSSLDKAVYGHQNAKRQVERILGQWTTGETSGYCFGFEGPPGVGKTSLALKGISECLKDENGVNRPFFMISMGGMSNGSTLVGHGYTYASSQWGEIVDILQKSKCMNPIIFIDELDKVSVTEYGREIIGILTHLTDSTQNTKFQDKYFNGINLDLSKVLFIFSYNNANLIDKILLDRIHRIKFKYLSMNEKKVIVHKYMFPEILSKMGMEGLVVMSEPVVTYLINTFTMEPGVRKLKDLLFDILGEINLEYTFNVNPNLQLPIEITKEDIKNKYLKDHNEVKIPHIVSENIVGFINGLWANDYGQGGMLHIEGNFYPADKMDLKLTGMQGDVMKESMNVAHTVAWNLIDRNTQIELKEKYKNQAMHIHVPEGATPKDGPSAGMAITLVIYSLLLNKPIPNHFAFTGEITLRGKVTKIGGLDLKLIGGIYSGVTSFVISKDNEDDLNKFKNENKDFDKLKEVTFHIVETIDDAIKVVFAE